MVDVSGGELKVALSWEPVLYEEPIDVNFRSIDGAQKCPLMPDLVGKTVWSQESSGPVSYDTTSSAITAFFGTQNSDADWTKSVKGGTTMGIRARQRFPEPTAFTGSRGAGSGIYDQPSAQTSPLIHPIWYTERTPDWNFDWSVDLGAAGAAFTGNVGQTWKFEIGMDFDPSTETNFRRFDPIMVSLSDNAIGISTSSSNPISCADCYAASATQYATLLSTRNMAQNSWNLQFFADAAHPLPLPSVAGYYTFYMAAFLNGLEVNRGRSVSVHALCRLACCAAVSGLNWTAVQKSDCHLCKEFSLTISLAGKQQTGTESWLRMGIWWITSTTRRS